MAEPRLGHYLYCVMPADARPALSDVVGTEAGHPLEVLRHAGLGAVVSRVSLTEFGAEPLQRNLNDLQWLERTARAHQAVLDRARAAGAVVPFRLCTVFAEETHVREMLERERGVLADALARLRGRDEWGVKLMADVRRLEEETRRRSSEPGRRSAGADAETLGRAYLVSRRRDRMAHEEAQQIAQRAAQEVHERLRQQATAATLLRPQSHELSRRPGAMVLNSAYLVDRARVEQFHAVAAELVQRQSPLGLELEVTGPWPPYNFVAPPTS
jgi:hypothetical protein